MRSNNKAGVALLAVPPLLPYALIIVLPIALAVGFSLFDWDGISIDMAFVGLENYAAVFADEGFRTAAVVTIAITVVGTAATVVVAMPLAVLLNSKGRLTTVQRAIIFAPTVLSPVVVGIVWQTFLSTSGLVNQTTGLFGLSPVFFLGEPLLAVVSLTFVTVWQNLGLITVLYLAGLQGIPREIYEAARLDGAASFQLFRWMTVPHLAATTVVTVLLLITGYLRLYDFVVVMTRGGPAGSTSTLAYVALQTAFTQRDYGAGSAMAILLLMLSLTVSIFTFFLLSRREVSE